MNRTLPKLSHHLKIKLRDLRIAKLEKKNRKAPCQQELDNYLAGASYGGRKANMKQLQQDLAECMDAPKPKDNMQSVNYHLTKFIKS